MRTEYLEYLLEVARTKSISAAAKKLFIGQTTLSAIINSVENELNVKIFQRTHRGVALRPMGSGSSPSPRRWWRITASY